MAEQNDAGFDERWYLERYPDAAAAVTEGLIPSGRAHYQRIGRAQGRLPRPLDEEFYRSRYPLVAAEIGSGLVPSLQDHYRILGHARGYLAAAEVARPSDAHAARSRFGGLWIDAPNAYDLVLGKYEIGLITEQEARRLLRFIEEGYVVLPGAAPDSLVAAAEAAVDRAYEGREAELLFECHALSTSPIAWQAGVTEHAAKALDYHVRSAAIRDLIFCTAVVRFLGLLFECGPLASQTLSFLRGSGQPAHQDSAYVPYSLPHQFAASWIALEDVTPGAGEIFYIRAATASPNSPMAASRACPRRGGPVWTRRNCSASRTSMSGKSKHWPGPERSNEPSSPDAGETYSSGTPTWHTAGCQSRRRTAARAW